MSLYFVISCLGTLSIYSTYSAMECPVSLEINVQKHFHYIEVIFIPPYHSTVLHGPAWLRLRVSYLVVRQHLLRTHGRLLRALMKSFPRTSMFFPSWSLPSNGVAIHSKGCSMYPFIYSSSPACSVSILRSSIISCLLITKCLDTRSVIRSPSSAILASSVSSDSIHHLQGCRDVRIPGHLRRRPRRMRCWGVSDYLRAVTLVYRGPRRLLVLSSKESHRLSR
jgi:hypothetical protein